jgi:hypothetical protein
MSRLVARNPNSNHSQQYEKHDVLVGYSAAMMLGNDADARKWAERMSAAFATSFDAFTALRFGRNEAALAVNPGAFGGASVRGLAALHLGRLVEARTFTVQIPATSFVSGYLPQLFQAELAEADGKHVEAERWMAIGVKNQRNVFSGELIPFFPAQESLGFIRLRAGDVAGAIVAFNDALAAYPNDPRALYGLSQALSASGDAAASAAARIRFEKGWEGADTNVQDALP